MFRKEKSLLNVKIKPNKLIAGFSSYGVPYTFKRPLLLEYSSYIRSLIQDSKALCIVGNPPTKNTNITILTYRYVIRTTNEDLEVIVAHLQEHLRHKITHILPPHLSWNPRLYPPVISIFVVRLQCRTTAVYLSANSVLYGKGNMVSWKVRSRAFNMSVHLAVLSKEHYPHRVTISQLSHIGGPPHLLACSNCRPPTYKAKLPLRQVSHRGNDCCQLLLKQQLHTFARCGQQAQKPLYRLGTLVTFLFNYKHSHISTLYVLFLDEQGTRSSLCDPPVLHHVGTW